MTVVQFVLLYILSFVLLSAAWVGTNIYLGWPWWAAVLGVVVVFIGVVVKFAWTISGWQGGAV
jgi:hypothetical protein